MSDETLVFDIETNGLLFPSRKSRQLTEVFCIGIMCLDDYRYRAYTGDDIIAAVERLNNAKVIIGHNVCEFDLPALEFALGVQLRRDHARDTLIGSRFLGLPRDGDAAEEIDLAFADHEMRELFTPLDDDDDAKSKSTWRYDRRNNHSLREWGRVLRFAKGDVDHKIYAGRRWVDLTAEEQAEMLHYLQRDVDLNAAIYLQLAGLWDDFPEPLRLEHEIIEPLVEQQLRGISFDAPAAEALVETIEARRDQLQRDFNRIADVRPKPTRCKVVQTENDFSDVGAAYSPAAIVQFNPGSSREVIALLSRLHGWVPSEWTEAGNVKLDKHVLSRLPFEEAALVLRYRDALKRISMIRGGRRSWLNSVMPDGRIYGSVNGIGADITHRMSMSSPNLQQVSRGAEERRLFRASPGMVLVDCDAVSIEARIQAAIAVKHDDGHYRDLLLSGADLHTSNQNALSAASREVAKALLYARTYGGGPPRLGQMWLLEAIKRGVIDEMPAEHEVARIGRDIRRLLDREMPGLAASISAATAEFDAQGYVVALDGRHLRPGSRHSAFNTLVQGNAAIIMKRALLLFYEWKRQQNRPIYFLLNVHDEILLETEPDMAALVAEKMKWAISEAGRYYNLPIPMDGEAKTGSDWSTVH